MMVSITPHAMTATRFRSAHSRPISLRTPLPRKSRGVLLADRAPAPAATARNAPTHRHPTMPRNSREPTLARQWELLKLIPSQRPGNRATGIARVSACRFRHPRRNPAPPTNRLPHPDQCFGVSVFRLGERTGALRAVLSPRWQGVAASPRPL